jgi:hypothetical protein
MFRRVQVFVVDLEVPKQGTWVLDVLVAIPGSALKTHLVFGWAPVIFDELKDIRHGHGDAGHITLFLEALSWDSWMGAGVTGLSSSSFWLMALEGRLAKAKYLSIVDSSTCTLKDEGCSALSLPSSVAPPPLKFAAEQIQEPQRLSLYSLLKKKFIYGHF